MISEASLNMTVWNAMTEALSHPSVIENGIQEVKMAGFTQSTEDPEIERSLKQIKVEELRVLEAYRLEILTPEQLAQELTALKARVSSLEARKSALVQQTKPEQTLVRRSIEEYCQLVAQKLESLNLEERRRLLRLLLRSVIFEGDQVKIRGIIPLGDSNVPPAEIMDGPSPKPERIASTASGHCARNRATERAEPLLSWADSHSAISFELKVKVEKDTTCLRAARLRNLMKANEAPKRGKSKPPTDILR
jgi:hypothetical protein